MSALTQRAVVEALAPDTVIAERAAQLGVPASIAARWQLASAFQVRHLHVVHADDQVVGVALAVHRPITAYEKLAGAWTTTGTAWAPLVASVVGAGVDAGAVAVKVELDPRAVSDVEALRDAALLAGFALAAEPVVGAAFPHEPHDVPAGLVRWFDGPAPRAVPYYRQTTEFTCGPVATAIALAALGDDATLTREGELRLWREATTLPGCDPFGLALGAHARGSRPAVLITTPDPILLEHCTQDWERDTRSFIQRDFRARTLAAGLTVRTGAFELDEVLRHVAAGRPAALLIDEHPMHEEPCPHWVTLLEVRDDVVVLHDPWTDDHLGESHLDAAHLPIRADQLARLSGWGDVRYHAALLF